MSDVGKGGSQADGSRAICCGIVSRAIAGLTVAIRVVEGTNKTVLSTCCPSVVAEGVVGVEVEVDVT